MTSNRLVVTVYGLPAPQGSKRHVGHGVMVESSKRVKPWREDVKQAALDALNAASSSWERDDNKAVSVHATFTLPRPRSHFRTGARAHELRDEVPLMHARRPDLDKLLRSTFDALTAAGVYGDDSRVVRITASKVYPAPTSVQPGALDRPGAVIVVQGVE